MVNAFLVPLGALVGGCLSVTEPCTVEEHADGSATMTCPDGTVQTIEPGQDGTDGQAGQDGQDGQDGQSHDNAHDALIQVDDCDDSEVACPECTDGGYRIQVGHDESGDGELQEGEVDKTYFVCQPEDGGGMGAGAPVLEVSEDSPPVSACPDGGTSILSGYDTTGDGEIDQLVDTLYVCDGDDAEVSYLVEVVAELPGENCPEGGYAVQTGPDENGDGEIDQITDTMYVCHQSSTFEPEWGSWYVTEWGPGDCWEGDTNPIWFEWEEGSDGQLEFWLGMYGPEGPAFDYVTGCEFGGAGGQELACASTDVEIAGLFASPTKAQLDLDDGACSLQVEHFEFAPFTGDWDILSMEGDECLGDEASAQLQEVGDGYELGVFDQGNYFPLGPCVLVGERLYCDGVLGVFEGPMNLQAEATGGDCTLELEFAFEPELGPWDVVTGEPSGCVEDDDWWSIEATADGRYELHKTPVGEPSVHLTTCDLDGLDLTDCEPFTLGDDTFDFVGTFTSPTELHFVQTDGDLTCQVALQHRLAPTLGPWEIVGASDPGCYDEAQWLELDEVAEGTFELQNVKPDEFDFTWTTCDLRLDALQACEPYEPDGHEFSGMFESPDDLVFAFDAEGWPEPCVLQLEPKDPIAFEMSQTDPVVLETADLDAIHFFGEVSSAPSVFFRGAFVPFSIVGGMIEEEVCPSMLHINPMTGDAVFDSGDDVCVIDADGTEVSGQFEAQMGSEAEEGQVDYEAFNVVWPDQGEGACDDARMEVDGRLFIYGDFDDDDEGGVEAFDVKARITSDVDMLQDEPTGDCDPLTTLYDYFGEVPESLTGDGGDDGAVTTSTSGEDDWYGEGWVANPEWGKVYAWTEGQNFDGDPECGDDNEIVFRATAGTTTLEGFDEGVVVIDYTLPEQGDPCEGVQWSLNGEPQGTLSGVLCSVVPVAATGWLTLLAMGLGLGHRRRRPQRRS